MSKTGVVKYSGLTTVFCWARFTDTRTVPTCGYKTGLCFSQLLRNAYCSKFLILDHSLLNVQTKSNFLKKTTLNAEKIGIHFLHQNVMIDKNN